MSEQAEAAQVLEDAADLLLVHGRCRLDAMDAEGRHCVVGAVMAARGVELRVGSVHVNAMTQIREHNNLTCGYLDPVVARIRERVGRDVGVWNDQTDDDDEIRDTLLLVAKDLRNEAVQ